MIRCLMWVDNLCVDTCVYDFIYKANIYLHVAVEVVQQLFVDCKVATTVYCHIQTLKRRTFCCEALTLSAPSVSTYSRTSPTL